MHINLICLNVFLKPFLIIIKNICTAVCTEFSTILSAYGFEFCGVVVAAVESRETERWNKIRYHLTYKFRDGNRSSILSFIIFSLLDRSNVLTFSSISTYGCVAPVKIILLQFYVDDDNNNNNIMKCAKGSSVFFFLYINKW